MWGAFRAFRRRMSRFTGMSPGLALAILLGLGGFASSHFDLMGVALSYLQGERLIVERRVLSTRPLAARERERLAFKLINFEFRPATVIGGRSSCSCLATEGLPTTIPPGESRNLEVHVTGRSQGGSLSQSIAYYTDDPAYPSITLQVTVHSRD